MRILILFSFLMTPAIQDIDGWEIFARVKFTPRYFKELDESFLCPFLDSHIRSYEGKEITLTGHYMPFDTEDGAIIISRYPYSMCFFCGGAGPESVAEVYPKNKRPKMKTDQIFTVKGKLKLNDNDVNHLNFILKEAVIITRDK